MEGSRALHYTALKADIESACTAATERVFHIGTVLTKKEYL